MSSLLAQLYEDACRENASLKRDLARQDKNMRARIYRIEELHKALRLISEVGGTVSDTEYGPLSHNGAWCAEQARAALEH